MADLRTADERYYFWRAPVDGLPEINSGGHAIEIVPGLGPYVLLHARLGVPLPEGAVSVGEVRKFLESRAKHG